MKKERHSPDWLRRALESGEIKHKRKETVNELLEKVFSVDQWVVRINTRTYIFEGYFEARRFAIYWDVDFPTKLKSI